MTDISDFKDRSLPAPSPETEPFWEGLKAERLLIPRCRACGGWHFYPKPACPHCGSADLAWAEASGDAAVYSFSTVHRAPSAAFKDEVPYTVLIVALAEGPHMMSRLVNADPETVEIGAPLRLAFAPCGEGYLPVFELAGQ
jgi:uncharacterized OB-fold protein